MIELKDVTIVAGQFSLSNVSFTIDAGEYAVLMGQTGQGKTTILEAICGLRTVASGQILIRGQDVTRWPPADRQTGFVPQDLALFPTMTVAEHLEFGLKIRKVSGEQTAARVQELSTLLGIDKLLTRSIDALSGGESQRVALGRALAFRPSVLLLDEPFSALDEQTRGEMYELLRNVTRSTGVTTLHITHSQVEARELASRRFLLEAGQIREQFLSQKSPEAHAT